MTGSGHEEAPARDLEALAQLAAESTGNPLADAEYIDALVAAAPDLIAKARRAEALEELVRLLYKTGDQPVDIVGLAVCGTHADGALAAIWTDDDYRYITNADDWTSDALALLAAVTSDGEVDR